MQIRASTCLSIWHIYTDVYGAYTYVNVVQSLYTEVSKVHIYAHIYCKYVFVAFLKVIYTNETPPHPNFLIRFIVEAFFLSKMP